MLIIVIDDDPMAAEMTVAIAEDAGHTILMAENGVDGLEMIMNHPDIELIISDLNMPLISGIDLFQELVEQKSSIPFILLTGDDPEEALSLEPRINACLMKDFSLQDSLIETIEQVMASRPVS